MHRLFAYPTPTSEFWALMALIAAAAVFWMAKRQGPVLGPAWAAIGLLIAAAMIPVAGYLLSFAPYTIHVSVVAPPGVPPERIKVWSSLQERSSLAGDGWEIQIPFSQVPADRTAIVWATMDLADLTHSQAVQLGTDHQPKVTIRLAGDRNSSVSGWVRDPQGRGVDELSISLADDPQGGVLTQMGGSFVLPVDALPGDQVKIQVVTRAGTKTQWVAAGDSGVVVTVEPK